MTGEPPADVDAAALIADAERVQGAAGLGHRKVMVLADGAGARLLDGFAAAGWEATRLVVMAHRTPPGRGAGPDGAHAEMVAPPVGRSAHALGLREQGFDAETVAEILEGRERVAAGVDRRTFAAFADGRPVAVADLLAADGIGQVEDVATLVAHRGRGLARAVVLAALGASRAEGHDLTLIVADEDDWPAEFYARLGFAPVAHIAQFLRLLEV